MDGGDGDDGGDGTSRPLPCAAPVGTYRYVVAPHLVSGPCVEPGEPPAEIAWFDSTKSHHFSVSSVDSTVTRNGDASSSHCEWNEDSSEAHCTVVAGACACELDLLR